MLADDQVSAGDPGVIITLSVLAGVMVLLIVITSFQPKESTLLTFKVPLVPVLPMLSVFFNLYLMFQLDSGTWIRFAVWVVIGYIIYFTYGIRHSVEGALAKEQAALTVNGNGHKPANKAGFDNNGFDASHDRIVSTIPTENPRRSSKNSYTFNNE